MKKNVREGTWDSVGVYEDPIMFNGELCYMFGYAYTNEYNGMPYSNQAFIGSKTLNRYNFDEVHSYLYR